MDLIKIPRWVQLLMKKATTKLYAQINDAIEKGAEVLAGNQYNADKEQGYFFVYPTVLTNVKLI